MRQSAGRGTNQVKMFQAKMFQATMFQATPPTMARVEGSTSFLLLICLSR
jgi:hypothetical protein